MLCPNVGAGIFYTDAGRWNDSLVLYVAQDVKLKFGMHFQGNYSYD